MMKKYLTFTVKAFQRTLTYRFELWMELLINVLFMLVYVYLWKALYTGRTSVEGYDLSRILTYIVVSQTLLTFTFTLRIARIIEEKVRTGEVVTDLMKPIDFQLMTLATAAGTSSHTALFNMLPKFLLFYGAFGLSLPSSLLTVFLFIISVVLGYVILFSIEFIIGIFAFWVVEIRGLYAFVIWGLAMLFSGYFLPLEFYSRFLSQNCGGFALSCDYLFSYCHLHRSINGRESGHGTVDTVGLGQLCWWGLDGWRIGQPSVNW